MVSTLKTASNFYQLQKKGKIARGLNKNKTLLKDNKGYYLIKNTSNSVPYKQRVKNNDLVYSRAEGVTRYNEKLDRAKTKIKTYQVSSGKEHNPYKQMSDRQAKSTSNRFQI